MKVTMTMTRSWTTATHKNMPDKDKFKIYTNTSVLLRSPPMMHLCTTPGGGAQIKVTPVNGGRASFLCGGLSISAAVPSILPQRRLLDA